MYTWFILETKKNAFAEIESFLFVLLCRLWKIRLKERLKPFTFKFKIPRVWIPYLSLDSPHVLVKVQQSSLNVITGIKIGAVLALSNFYLNHLS